ncbi:glycosyltransferase [Sorangium sp. So ce385]|uniref:glycosyltransferase n=1 Tax=Sorangium sp. So ce385 TaxID=3133308 RepID=UPI003F5B0C9F
MRVLHVLHTSLPVIAGYTIRSDYIVKHQAEHGMRPAVVTSAQQGSGDALKEEIGGISYWRTREPSGKKLPLVRELSLVRALEARVEDAIREFQPDVVHAHSPMLVGLPALAAARRFGLPLVYEVRDLWENASVDRGKFAEDSVPYKIAAGLETVVYKYADATVTICESLKNAVAPRVRSTDALYVVGNGVDSDKFAPREAPPGAWERFGLAGKRLIGYVGTFQPYEGLQTLIASIGDIAREIPDAHVVITGAGGQEMELKAFARERGVESKVTFTGRVPHDEVFNIYAMASLLVYPRIRTRTTALTTPLKPLEAMSMARPVMVSDVPAMGELVRYGETGFVFKAGDSADLTRRCVEALKDPERLDRVGKSAREWILKERQWPTLLSRYPAIYEQAIAARRGRGKAPAGEARAA